VELFGLLAAIVMVLQVLLVLLSCVGCAVGMLFVLFAIFKQALRACLGGRASERPRPRRTVALRGCGVGRCAYCHDVVAIDDRAACAACLAVHHEECWEGRCAACSAALALRSSGRSARPDAGPRGERIARR
jgi:hypothetical protein